MALDDWSHWIILALALWVAVSFVVGAIWAWCISRHAKASSVRTSQNHVTIVETPYDWAETDEIGW